jgi:hypothetical protein
MALVLERTCSISILSLCVLLGAACFAESSSSSDGDDSSDDGTSSGTGGDDGGTATDGATDDGATDDGSDATTGGSSGSGTTGDTGSDGPTGTATDTGTDDPTGTATDGSTGQADTDPPTVVSVTPSNGTTQVYEETVSIVFSEAMNEATVEAAYPLGSNFAWSGGGAEVTFDYAFPFSNSPVVHALDVPTSVEDVAGNALAQTYNVSVTLASLISVTLDYDGNLTGNQVEGENGNFTFFMAGDTGADARLYGAVSFVIDGLPTYASILAIRNATFRSQVISTSGDPNAAALGGFIADHVSYASRVDIDDPTLLSVGFGMLFDPGDIVVGDACSIDVASELDASWSVAATNFQIRFSPVSINADATADRIYLRRVADENDGIVAPGVADPDAANRARLEIEYFE